ncbi:hypothetical protein VOI54_15500 [Tamlana sp. 2201CG12-4]|uniref:hypothetical protein n=1 Tax=Tamlana sp. 2201CG12-4 TaxID=3112582 RepID=UPI002DBDEC8F|nr:hypothetical protein [Tamlana sp. 2201CG12-4]MEC3908435.1 hypothetical protein [Tamlana sp. 2201CG12-4]
MKTIIIVGGSKGIENAILKKLTGVSKVVNISRTTPKELYANLVHFFCDTLQNDLPNLDAADGLIYYPGSINLKPISGLSLDNFKNDFEINVLGAIKAIQYYLPVLKMTYALYFIIQCSSRKTWCALSC